GSVCLAVQGPRYRPTVHGAAVPVRAAGLLRLLRADGGRQRGGGPVGRRGLDGNSAAGGAAVLAVPAHAAGAGAGGPQGGQCGPFDRGGLKALSRELLRALGDSKSARKSSRLNYWRLVRPARSRPA